MGSLQHSSVKVREKSDSELRFGVVRGVDQGFGVLDGGPCCAMIGFATQPVPKLLWAILL